MDDASLDDHCFERVTSDDFEHCKALCNADRNCKGIEVDNDGTHCELWTNCMPTLTNEATTYHCYLKDLRKTLFISQDMLKSAFYDSLNQNPSIIVVCRELASRADGLHVHNFRLMSGALL